MNSGRWFSLELLKKLKILNLANLFGPLQLLFKRDEIAIKVDDFIVVVMLSTPSEQKQV
jgi:hypothetical protein